MSEQENDEILMWNERDRQSNRENGVRELPHINIFVCFHLWQRQTGRTEIIRFLLLFWFFFSFFDQMGVIFWLGLGVFVYECVPFLVVMAAVHVCMFFIFLAYKFFWLNSLLPLLELLPPPLLGDCYWKVNDRPQWLCTYNMHFDSENFVYVLCRFKMIVCIASVFQYTNLSFMAASSCISFPPSFLCIVFVFVQICRFFR